MSESNTNNSGRDARGRFGPGNPGGPGGSRKREFRRAVENAVSPDHVGALMRKATVMGLGGDTRAMRMVFDQTVGRPPRGENEPEIVDLQLPEMTTPANCGKAAELLMAGMLGGKLNRELGETLLGGVQTRLNSFLAAQKERERDAVAAPARAIPNKVLRVLFTRFKKTGLLPEDATEGWAIFDKIRDGYDVVEVSPDSTTLTLASLDGFVKKDRPKADNMDALLYEAIAGPEPVRWIARGVLRAFALMGKDLTTDILNGHDIPPFGSVACHLIGFPKAFTKVPHRAQLKRLFVRIAAAQKRQPTTYAEYVQWKERMAAATPCFYFDGERPSDPSILDDVLCLGEIWIVGELFWGKNVRRELKLFDTAARASGDEREQAISEIQALAKAGRFMDS